MNINGNNAPRTKKFWCHYIGRDGNAPKRRSIELTDLASLIPAIGDNEHCATPLWYEAKDDGYGHKDYFVYAQLSDTVAVRAQRGISDWNVEEINKTDEEIEAHWNEWAEERKDDPYQLHPDRDYHAEAERYISQAKASRDELKTKEVNMLHMFMDYDTFLLTQATWIMKSELAAYADVQSPLLSTFQAIRKEFEKQREEKHRQYMERERERRKEEHRKAEEAAAKEFERLTHEAEKYKAGEAISGSDVVELCRRYGIKVHLRTIHNLQCVISWIKPEQCNYHSSGKRSPKLDGCFDAAKALYDYLQNHEIA